MDETIASIAAREASDDDVAGLARFLRASWAEAGPGAPGFAGASDAVIDALAQPDELRRHLGRNGERLFVGTSGGEVLGFASTRPLDPGRVELTGVVVRRAASGRGLGSRLVELATEAAVRDAFRVMVVRTETTNAAAIAFYRHLGFEPAASVVEEVDGTTVEVLELHADLATGRESASGLVG